MERVIPVGLGELTVSEDVNSVLVAFGLGSCVCITAFDPARMIGGMLHAMLPHQLNGDRALSKFVDTGIVELQNRMAASGAMPDRLLWRFSGGARLLTTAGLNGRFDVGEKNVAAVWETAAKCQLAIEACDVGGHSGRTVFLYIKSGCLRICDSDGKEHDFEAKALRAVL